MSCRKELVHQTLFEKVFFDKMWLTCLFWLVYLLQSTGTAFFLKSSTKVASSPPAAKDDFLALIEASNSNSDRSRSSSNENRGDPLILLSVLEESSLNRRNSKRDLSGCLQVLSTSIGAKEPAWTQYSKLLGALSQSRNRNFQFFSKGNDKFMNLSEYVGSTFFATASGTYKQIGKLEFAAKVNRIDLHFWKGKFKLRFSVDGEGVVKLIFDDNDIRVLVNEDAAYAAQKYVKAPKEYMAMLREADVQV